MKIDRKQLMYDRIVNQRNRIMSDYMLFYCDELPEAKNLVWCRGEWRIGGSSATNRKERLRFIKASDLLIEPHITFSNANMAYLKNHLADYPGSLNKIAPKQEIALKGGAPPMYATPYTGELLYFDLRAWHANIMIAFGRDVNYYPKRWVHPNPNMDDYPFFDNKDAYVRLWSTAFPAPAYESITNEVRKQRKASDIFANRALVRLTYDLSLMVAKFAIERGAVYCNLDGCFFPVEYKDDAFALFDYLAFPYKIKGAGMGSVYHFGKYEIAASVFSNYKPIVAGRKFKPTLAKPRALPDFDAYAMWDLVRETVYAARPNYLQTYYTPEALSRLTDYRQN
jgi:hypothetical protein